MYTFNIHIPKIHVAFCRVKEYVMHACSMQLSHPPPLSCLPASFLITHLTTVHNVGIKIQHIQLNQQSQNERRTTKVAVTSELNKTHVGLTDPYILFYLSVVRS